MTLRVALNDENAAGGGAAQRPPSPCPLPPADRGKGGGRFFLFFGRAAEPPAQKTIFQKRGRGGV